MKPPLRHLLPIPLLPFFLLFFLSCSGERFGEKPPVHTPSGPWHGIERSVRYRPDGTDFVILNGERRFNRALYGTNTAFRVEAGDLPEFALYLPGMGGNFRLGIGDGGNSLWLIEADRVEARYRPGSMIYRIRDSLLGDGELTLHLLALREGEGFILRVQAQNLQPGQAKDKLQLYWAFGGATGKKFRRGGDIGAGPVSIFCLNPEYCRDNEFGIREGGFTLFFGEDRRIEGQVPPGNEIRICDARSQASPRDLFQSDKSEESLLSGRMSLPEDASVYFTLSVPDPQETEAGPVPRASPDPGERFLLAEKAREELSGRIRVHTPDPYINTLGGALSMAADAIWEPPSYLHGAVAWRDRLVGWRGAYAADWLGWHDRARMHFEGYAKAQYTEPESAPAAPDPGTHLSRQIEKAGYSLFSSGYISRRPGQINPPHHYDMNLVYMDQLFWHFNWTGDLELARELWPVIRRHFAWEKRCFDADGDGLYDAYCCIWASDALQYSGGGVTHSTAYNYRGNLLAGRLASLIGEDPRPYLAEATKIQSAVNTQLWLPRRGWYAEYKDHLGLQLVHPSAGLWTIYHALDGELPDPFQAYQCLRYVDEEIPHIPILADGMPPGDYCTLSTSNWMPYSWSINNVALAENLHACLAYWQGGRSEEAFRLWKGQLLESMFNGACPGNFQQLSFYDAFRGELYRDFADPVGMAARTLVEGLFGIVPDALGHTLTIGPGFPQEWDSASLVTPDLSFSFERRGREDRYTLVQHLPVEMDLRLRLKAQGSGVKSLTVNGHECPWKVVETSVGNPVIEIPADFSDTLRITVHWTGMCPDYPTEAGEVAAGDRLEARFQGASVLGFHDPQEAAGDEEYSGDALSFRAMGLTGHRTVFVQLQYEGLKWWQPLHFTVQDPVEFLASLTGNGTVPGCRMVNHGREARSGKLTVNGYPLAGAVELPAGSSARIAISTEFLLPGTNRIGFREAGGNHIGDLVLWDLEAREDVTWETPDLGGYFNDRVDRIFRNEYLSPRAASPTLQIPVQGIGDWCSYMRLPVIGDSGLRARAGEEGRILLDQGIPFRTPGEPDAPNILYTSRWDNYPAEASIPLSGRARHAYFLMTGSAHHMQSRMCNGVVRIRYADGSSDSLALVQPDSWWPIEQDYYEDGFAFRLDAPRPPRIWLKSGEQQHGAYPVRKVNGTNEIDGGAATLYDLPLDPARELESLSLETLANDVVIGLMAVSLVRAD